RNWYDHRLPMFGLASESQDEFLQWAQSLVNAAVESTKLLRDQVKKALFNRPKDVKGDLSYLDVEFLSKTEAAFYQQLRQLIDEAHQGDTVHPQEVFTTWYKTLRSTLTTIFDQQVLNCAVEERDLKRVLEARTGMLKIFEKTKSITAIKPPKDTKQKEKANV
ncbi:MAG: type I-E CRISPR-associated protein Cse1/CasA, partial [Pontibacterium sp.]